MPPIIDLDEAIPNLGQPGERIRDRSAKKAGQPDLTLDGGASINPEVLRNLRDSTLGLKIEDRDAYFRILKLASLMSFGEMQDLAIEYRKARIAAHDSKAATDRKFSPFVDLFLNPDAYRGKPVVLRGTLRKLIRYEPGPNEEGITAVYEGWLYAADSQNNPAVVVFTEKPQGMPLGGDLVEEVVIAGYFFKMYGYEAQDQPRKAPMILAGQIEWIAPIQKQSLHIPVWVYGIAGLVALWIVVGTWTFRADKRRLPDGIRVPRTMLTDIDPGQFHSASLAAIDIPSKAAFLSSDELSQRVAPPGLPARGVIEQEPAIKTAPPALASRSQIDQPKGADGFPDNPQFPPEDESI
jgi:hypothetical protein